MNTGSPVKISVQICSFNRKDLLKRSLEALFKVDFPSSDFEVVLVDDGSADGTAEMVKSLVPPCRLKYFYQPNSGLAAGRNLGIRNADGEVVLFIDDDIMSDPALLKEHWKYHQNNPKCVVMGWVNHVDNLENDLMPKFTMADVSTSFFWTSNCSVRKKFLEEVGLFDEDFKEYGWEDLEIGHRLRKHGLERVYNRKALVYHYKKRWRASDLPRLYRQAESSGRSAVIYLRKRPYLRTRLSTGIYPLKIAFTDALRFTEGFCRRMVNRAGDKPLGGLSLICARLIMSFHYFDSVKSSLAKK